MQVALAVLAWRACAVNLCRWLEGHMDVFCAMLLQVCAGAVVGVLFGIFYPTPDMAAATAAAQLIAAA